ncbi:MAG: prepilin-type N-terminal cleavage/methylation domain-containing protein [Planctomycetota bacterium]|nr:prepilin-type N-terminal cleavage/methylation domain-containing protein [Planctomycetota bacterium]
MFSKTEKIATHRRGFSLTELMVVVAIIALLAGLVIVAAQKVHRMSNMAGDLNNQRQIALAFSSYSMDFNGAIPSNRTSPDGNFNYTLNPTAGSCGGPFTVLINNGSTAATTYHSWTASYGAGVVGGTEYEYGLNTTTVPTANALSGGKLWNYIGDYGVYRSPLDPTARIRSYSINSFVGATVPEDSNEWANKWDDWFCVNGVPMTATNTTKISRIPQPARTICSIVEDDSDGFNYNNQGWVIDPRFPGTPQAGGWEGWIDWPAMWDPTAIPFSYVDGSTEVYSVQNPELPDDLDLFGHRYAQPSDLSDPTYGAIRLDWIYFRDRLLPGIVPEGPYKSIGF